MVKNSCLTEVTVLKTILKNTTKMLTTNYLYQKQYLATAKFIVPRKKKYFV